MTSLLERAFAAASELPAADQDAVASLLLAEMESESRWSAAFASTRSELENLAEEAMREYSAGRTRKVECDDFQNH